jgi:hypothetical protein
MLKLDLTDIDPAAPLLVECWYCSYDHLYDNYDHYVQEQKRNNEWLDDADGNILCVRCGIERYPDLIW